VEITFEWDPERNAEVKKTIAVLKSIKPLLKFLSMPESVKIKSNVNQSINSDLIPL